MNFFENVFRAVLYPFFVTCWIKLFPSFDQDECSPDQQVASSFAQMSDMLKECMLGQRWDEASEILRAMCLYQTPETDYQWKVKN